MSSFLIWDLVYMGAILFWGCFGDLNRDPNLENYPDVVNSILVFCLGLGTLDLGSVFKEEGREGGGLESRVEGGDPGSNGLRCKMQFWG